MQTDWDLLAGTHFVARRELKEQDVERQSRGLQLEQDCPSQRPRWAGGCWGVLIRGSWAHREGERMGKLWPRSQKSWALQLICYKTLYKFFNHSGPGFLICRSKALD